MTRVGWSNSSTADCYLKLTTVLHAGAPADLLASRPTEEAAQIFTDYYQLKRYFGFSYSRYLGENATNFLLAFLSFWTFVFMVWESRF